MKATIRITLLFCLLNFSIHAHYRVLGIGSYVWDYIQPVDERFLEAVYLPKRGWKDLDWAAFSEVLALSRSQAEPTLMTGGSVANTIKGLASLGIPSALTGNVGYDRRGDILIYEMEKCGITPLVTRSNTPTAHVISLVTPDGERSFCTFIDSEKETCEEDILPQYFKGVDLVHIEGYLIPNRGVVEKAARLAMEQGATVSYDIGNQNIGEKYRERLWGLLNSYIDVLFMDVDEAYALTHLDPEHACRFLSNFCHVAVVKIGEKGCYVASGKDFIHQPAIPTTVVDSTGGGDLFASGFLYGYLHGESLERCALFGNLMGSAAIENFGGEIPPARLSEIVQAMK
ncbi:MAG: adenosine kinase [Chlamydiales bacterium]|nr:adenosine kinase [Chlamydiales bacterium]